ncbi:MAG: hypothetical protein K8I00_08970, partial [Candidatus Omnitrophica bacterium]|nr:hypothetical protein [Candidatus Omnitrophota bacterium]
MKKNSFRIFGLMCGIWSLGGTSPGAAGVVVQTDKPQYTTGDEVVITIRNELTEPIYYLGMCALSDCLLEGDEWRCEQSNCDAPQEVMLAGEEKIFHIQVVGLIVGDMKYRFEYTTAIMERNSQALSNDFFIISTGEPERMSIAEQIQQFPLSDPSTTPRFRSVGSGASQRRDNKYIARNFKNQDIPSNQEVIRQRKR